jgi:hypothetical protein
MRFRFRPFLFWICFRRTVSCLQSSVFRLLPPVFCLLSGVWRLLLPYICREPSTNRPYFMQNKPNFRKSQMNVNKTITKDYGNWTLGQRGKNKPNSKPIQTQSKPISETPKMNVTSFFTKDYRNELARAAGTNKPKQTQSNPIPNVGKMNATFCTTIPYVNEPRTMNYERLPKTNPIKPNFQPDGHNRAQSGK